MLTGSGVRILALILASCATTSKLLSLSEPRVLNEEICCENNSEDVWKLGLGTGADLVSSAKGGSEQEFPQLEFSPLRTAATHLSVKEELVMEI